MNHNVDGCSKLLIHETTFETLFPSSASLIMTVTRMLRTSDALECSKPESFNRHKVQRKLRTLCDRALQFFRKLRISKVGHGDGTQRTASESYGLPQELRAQLGLLRGDIICAHYQSDENDGSKRFEVCLPIAILTSELHPLART